MPDKDMLTAAAALKLTREAEDQHRKALSGVLASATALAEDAIRAAGQDRQFRVSLQYDHLGLTEEQLTELIGMFTRRGFGVWRGQDRLTIDWIPAPTPRRFDLAGTQRHLLEALPEIPSSASPPSGQQPE